MSLTRVLTLLLVAAVAVGVSAQDPRIHVKVVEGVIDDGAVVIAESKTIKLEFSLTSQIIVCHDAQHDFCGVTVLLTNSHPDEIAMSACHVEWTKDTAHEKRYITVTGVEDFVDDGEKLFMLITEPAVSKSAYYSGFDMVDLNIKTQDRPTAMCSSNTDPNYNTFDGKAYVWSGAGDIVLWRADHRQFEVQTRVDESLNCAVAIKDGCNTIKFDMCSMRKTLNAALPSLKTDFKSSPEPKIEKINSGDVTFRITFESGAVVKLIIKVDKKTKGTRHCGWSGCHWSYEHSVSRWIDIYVTAPGADFGLDENDNPRTWGACGSFDNNRANEPKNINAFVITDRSKNMFKTAPACVAPKVRDPTDYDKCEHVQQFVTRPILSHPDIEDITDLIKQATALSLLEEQNDEQFEFVANPVEEQEWTPAMEAQWTQFCSTAVTESPVYKPCSLIVDVNRYIANCVANMKFQNGNQDLVWGTIDLMKEECEFFAAKNLSSFMVDPASGAPARDANGNLVLTEKSKAIVANKCPGDCSFNGVCSEGACQCDAEFIGPSCQIRKGAVPEVAKLSPFSCDRSIGEECPAAVSVHGLGFVQGSDLQCRVNGEPAPARFISLAEVSCGLPASFKHTGSQPVVMHVEVSNNGGANHTTPLPFVYHDSSCQVCDREGACTAKAIACALADHCYLQGEFSPSNPCMTCQPGLNTLALSPDYTDADVCKPRFERQTYEVAFPEDMAVGAEIVVVNGANPLITDETPRVTYSLVEPSDMIAVDQNTGSVTVKKTVDFERDATLQHVATVRARDYLGRTADATLHLTTVNVNEPPVFQDASYTTSVPENANAISLITAVATDDDSVRYDAEYAEVGNWGAVTYSVRGLETQQARDLFLVDAQSGELTLTGPLDFESAPAGGYAFELVATDGGDISTAMSIKINVIDVNEKPKFIALSNNQVPEMSAVGFEIGYLSTVDHEVAQTHSYTMVNSASNRFALKPLADGRTAVVANTNSLDYETTPRRFTIEVKSTDSGTPALDLTLDFEIEVTNVNDAPRGVHLYSVEYTSAPVEETSGPAVEVALTQVKETTPVGATVGYFVADDDETNQRHTFTIQGDSPFAVSASGTELILAQPLDFESGATTFTFAVVAEDDGIPALSSQPVSFTVSVEDVDEGPGSFRLSGAASFSEDTTPGSVVGTVSASDEKPGRPMTISVEGDQFTVGPTTCEDRETTTFCSAPLILSQSLDFETAKTVDVVVVAKSDVTDKETRFTLSSIPVADKNDEPTGVAPAEGYPVPENVAVGTLVGSIGVVDEDADSLYEFTLDHEFFEIVTSDARRAIGSSAQIRTKAEIDFEQQQSFSLNVQVKDGGFTKIFAMPIQVTDVPTKVLLDGGVVSESVITSSAPFVIGTLSVQDGNGLAATFQLTKDFGVFAIVNGDKLAVKQNAILNFEAKDSYAVPVQVVLGASGSVVTTVVTVTVTDSENDPDVTVVPRVSHSGIAGAPINLKAEYEGIVVAQAVARAAAPGSVTYALGDAEEANMFEMDSATGELTLTRWDQQLLGDDLTVRITVTAGSVVDTADVDFLYTNDCTGIECQNGGFCVDQVNDFKCECVVDGFEGRYCQNAKPIAPTDAVNNNVISAGQSNTNGASSSSSSSSGASASLIIGVVVGALIILVLIVVLVLVMIRRSREQKLGPMMDSGAGAPMAMNNANYMTSQMLDRPAQTKEEAYATFNNSDQFRAGALNPMYSWYRPDMSAQAANQLLANQPEGAFVVRDLRSTPGWHMLHRNVASEILTEKICGTEGTYQIVMPNGQQPSFPSMPALVRYFSQPSPYMSVPLYMEQAIYDNSELNSTETDDNEIRPHVPTKGMRAPVVEDIYDNRDIKNVELADENRHSKPCVPLKDKEQDAAALFAVVNEGDEMYLNVAEAVAGQNAATVRAEHDQELYAAVNQTLGGEDTYLDAEYLCVNDGTADADEDLYLTA